MEKGGMIDADTAKTAFGGFTSDMVDSISKEIDKLKGEKIEVEKQVKRDIYTEDAKKALQRYIDKLTLDIEEKQALIAQNVATNVATNVSGKSGDKVDTKKEVQNLSDTVGKVSTTAAKGTSQQVAAEVNAAPSTSTVTRTFVASTFESSLILDYFSETMSKEQTGELKSTLDKVKSTNSKLVSKITSNKGTMTAVDVDATRQTVAQATVAAQKIVNSKQYKGLTRGQAIMGITFILSIAGLGGYIAYNDTATNDAIDKLTKTILGLNKKNTDGCFLVTNKGYSRLDDDCSTWYSTGDNKFSCGCGTLTDTKQTPDCSTLKDNDRDCSAPYCLGQTNCTNPIDPAKTSKCTIKDKPTEPLYQCTGKDLDDPNFISYAYSDSLPLEPLISSYKINKEIYNQYYSSNQDKTLMYVSVGISALSLLVLIFFIVRYYMRKK